MTHTHKHTHAQMHAYTEKQCYIDIIKLSWKTSCKKLHVNGILQYFNIILVSYETKQMVRLFKF